MENRVFTRWHMPMTIKYTLPDGASGKIHVEDFSLGGVCLPFAQKSNISPGTNLTLRIRMPKRKRETVVLGEVVWLQKADASKDAGYIAGIKFIKADPVDMEEIVTSLRTGLYFVSLE